jgi:aspartyl-tRNA(Asn)/glutamyl-tRNA(Gln) amidotransferase subunit A
VAVTASERAREALRLAEALAEPVGAFAELTPQLAVDAAERADDAVADGSAPGPLHGLPLAVKDVIDVAGVPTRLGTPGAGHRVPGASARAVELATAAGAIAIGKAHTHELALGMVTPQTRNPIDTGRIAGGSSGGSAAAVAAGIAAIALGTDTNGSTRCPASLCGIVGLRPTRGAISRRGVAPLAWTQDTVGLLAADAQTCARLYTVLAEDAGGRSRAGPRRVGVDRGAIAAAEPAVSRACAEALDGLAGTGVELVDVALPEPALAGSVAAVVLCAEAAAAWRRELASQPEGFGPQVRAALRAGAELRAGDYLDAKRARALVCARVRGDFDRLRLTAVATPTLPATAARAGAATIESGRRERPIDAVYSRFTALASVTGQPAVSVPCGLDGAGLAIGLQLIGRPHGESALFDLAAEVERLPGSRAVAGARAAAADRLAARWT